MNPSNHCLLWSGADNVADEDPWVIHYIVTMRLRLGIVGCDVASACKECILHCSVLAGIPAPGAAIFLWLAGGEWQSGARCLHMVKRCRSSFKHVYSWSWVYEITTNMPCRLYLNKVTQFGNVKLNHLQMFPGSHNRLDGRSDQVWNLFLSVCCPCLSTCAMLPVTGDSEGWRVHLGGDRFVAEKGITFLLTSH